MCLQIVTTIGLWVARKRVVVTGFLRLPEHQPDHDTPPQMNAVVERRQGPGVKETDQFVNSSPSIRFQTEYISTDYSQCRQPRSQSRKCSPALKPPTKVRPRFEQTSNVDQVPGLPPRHV